MSETAAGRPALSVATVARDEEDRLLRALDSVTWAEEMVVVVDSRTRDRTGRVARERGARVVRRDWTGYADQKAHALELCRGPWVLLLDADEVVTPELAAEIRRTLAEDPDASGYEIPFHTRFLGSWLGRRGWHTERHLRLVLKEKAKVTPRPVHVGLEVAGEVGRLGNPILHYSIRDTRHLAEKMAASSRLKSRWMHDRGRRVTLPGAALRSVLTFVRGYLLRGRFLDGRAGLIWEMAAACYNLLAYVGLWELNRAAGEDLPTERAAGEDLPTERAAGDPPTERGTSEDPPRAGRSGEGAGRRESASEDEPRA